MREHAALAPNYLLVDEALRTFTARGARSVDLGFSHDPSLVAFKSRWGARRAAYHQIDPSALRREEHHGQ
jgi:hypothetical protein